MTLPTLPGGEAFAEGHAFTTPVIRMTRAFMAQARDLMVDSTAPVTVTFRDEVTATRFITAVSKVRRTNPEWRKVTLLQNGKEVTAQSANNSMFVPVSAVATG